MLGPHQCPEGEVDPWEGLEEGEWSKEELSEDTKEWLLQGAI